VKSGAVLLRSSQPEVGWFGWRCHEDENIPVAVVDACILDPGPTINQISSTLTAVIANNLDNADDNGTVSFFSSV